MSEWIPVSERLPKLSTTHENDALFLVWTGVDYEFAFFDGPGSWDSPEKGWLKCVTHWKPLEPPK